MPRVTLEHAEARRRQIMDAARTCFLRDGFHATSMQDILREADLSAGAFYLYFKRKEDVVVAIAEEAIGSVAMVFTDLAAMEGRPPFEELLGTIMDRVQSLHDGLRVFPIALQAWAESFRSPELAAQLHEVYMHVRGQLAGLLAAYQADGAIADDVSPDVQAAVIMTMVQGFIVQHAMFQALDADAFRAGLRSLMPRA